MSAFFSENLWLCVKEAEGIEAAKLRGVCFGRPKLETGGKFERLIWEYEKKKICIGEVLTELKISRATFYRRLKEYRAEKRKSLKKCTL